MKTFYICKFNHTKLKQMNRSIILLIFMAILLLTIWLSAKYLKTSENHSPEQQTGFRRGVGYV